MKKKCQNALLRLPKCAHTCWTGESENDPTVIRKSLRCGDVGILGI